MSVAASKHESVSDKDMLELKVTPRSQVGLGKLFAVKRKNKNNSIDLSHTSGDVHG